MRDRYITAVLDLIAAGHSAEDVVRGLRETLARRDHSRLYPSVLRGVLRTLTDGARATTARVTVANAAATERLAAEIAKHLATVGASEHTIVTDDTIIGGVVVEYGHQRIDASYKRALSELYDRTIA